MSEGTEVYYTHHYSAEEEALANISKEWVTNKEMIEGLYARQRILEEQANKYNPFKVGMYYTITEATAGRRHIGHELQISRTYLRIIEGRLEFNAYGHFLQKNGYMGRKEHRVTWDKGSVILHNWS